MHDVIVMFAFKAYTRTYGRLTYNGNPDFKCKLKSLKKIRLRYTYVPYSVSIDMNSTPYGTSFHVFLDPL